MSDVLPLLSSVVGVPEGSGGEVEAHGEGEGGNEGGGDEDRVSSEEGVVDDVLESGHFETDGLCICGMQRAGWDS